MSSTTQPKMMVKPNVLYFGDNGALFCGACAGMSVQCSGRDLSGQKVARMTAKDAAYMVAQGCPATCEGCGKGYTAAGK